MRLEDLVAYAWRTYRIEERRAGERWPGASYLADPVTGKWIALLLRGWNEETGEMVERCDLRCGRQSLREFPVPFLGEAVRMQGPQWVGVRFTADTDPALVRRLFDRAVHSGEQKGYTLVVPPSRGEEPVQPALFPVGDAVPARIRAMIRLYAWGDGSFRQKCRNFLRQGRFMADYEDSQPWTGSFFRYFPTYHDLTVPQLRGYFTWRTWVRGGIWKPVSPSFAYLYLYELLAGIGTESPEDALERMRAFEHGFLDPGWGDERMRHALHRWMVEFCVLKDLPAESARSCMEEQAVARDRMLDTLVHAGARTDGDVCGALGVKPASEAEARLTAAVWRTVRVDGIPIASLVVGERKKLPWYPLGNAVYVEEHPVAEREYVLDAVRSFHCRDGVWEQDGYDDGAFDRKRLEAFLHETARQVGAVLKNGSRLRRRKAEAWATEPVAAAIAEARRPKIALDLSGLERIRDDALAIQRRLVPEDAAQEPEPEREASAAAPSLGDLWHAVLEALLQGADPRGIMKAGHLLPSVVADGINEALYDEVGDNVLSCDGERLELVDEYRDEVADLLKEGTWRRVMEKR